MKKLWLIGIILLATGLCAQQEPGQGQNQGPTEPQIGYAAQSQTQNTLVGCVSGSANDLLLVQEQRHRTYHLQGNTADLKNDLGKLVKITGRLMPGATLEVESAQSLGQSCRYAAGEPAMPATGKTGAEGEALNATTTGSQGQVTPGFDTPAGRAQAPGTQGGLDTSRVPQPQNRSAMQGAPPVPEQTAQNPADAKRIAEGAQRAELENPQHQLGVNAQPNYSANGNPQKPEENPRQQEEQEAATEQTHPTLVGCLTQDPDGRQFSLTEQKSGNRYRLNGPEADLKEHVNHLVEIIGRPATSEGAPAAAAGSKEAAFEVRGVQDLAPTCGTERPR